TARHDSADGTRVALGGAPRARRSDPDPHGGGRAVMSLVTSRTGEARAQAELEASRARLVDAADEARRGLERNLHDGAQQRFVLALIWLQRAAAQTRDTAAAALVDHALDLVQEGVDELRDLAHGLHPAVLDKRGLHAAL